MIKLVMFIIIMRVTVLFILLIYENMVSYHIAMQQSLFSGEMVILFIVFMLK